MASVGIPRALLYHRYGKLWTEFFQKLGFEVIISKPTNREILENGISLSIDESCLSAKIFFGHVNELVNKCDYLFIPRYSNIEKKLSYCTRFEALFDLVRNTFPEIKDKVITANIDKSNYKMTEKDAFIEMGVNLGFSKRASIQAYKAARKAYEDDITKKVKLQEKLINSDSKLKILMCAHGYILMDEYFGKPMYNYLKSMGVTPIRGDISKGSQAKKAALKISPTLKWQMSREIIGNIEMYRNKIDGIILASAFPCGPDSLSNEAVTRKVKDVPILILTIDEQTGSAGIETRLESFVDILKLKKGILNG